MASSDKEEIARLQYKTILLLSSNSLEWILNTHLNKLPFVIFFIQNSS